MKNSRISGILNNCALNCALPEIFEQLEKVSKGERVLSAAHKEFKEIFDKHYHLSKSFSWEDFIDFIRQHTFSENEFIFAPIIREFIALQAQKLGGGHEESQILKEIVDDPLAFIDEEVRPFLLSDDLLCLQGGTGRYYALTIFEASRYFYQPFGLTMVVHEYVNGSYLMQAPIDGCNNLRVNTYLKDGHYELQPHHVLNNGEFLNPILQEVFDIISSHSSKNDTDRALNILYHYVHQYITDKSYGVSTANFEAPLLENPNIMISREVLSQCLQEYQSYYVVFHFILWVITLGYHQARSGTVCMLDELLQQSQQDFFSKDDIGMAINDNRNTDSRKNDRYQFWTHHIQPSYPKTGTDEVLAKLSLKFVQN